MAELKKDWVLNPGAFQRLLEWLERGGDSAGDGYLEVRRRLTAYFDRKNCHSSDELADETLNRIARKLEEKGTIIDVSPLHYCYIVAKFVFLESFRRAKLTENRTTEFLASDCHSPDSAAAFELSAGDSKEKLFGCLEECLNKLAVEDRELILEYYRGGQRVKIERRSELANCLGLTANALCIRACRIRNKLEACVKTCSSRK